MRAEILDEVSNGNFFRAYRTHIREHPDATPEDAIIRPWMHSGGTEDA